MAANAIMQLGNLEDLSNTNVSEDTANSLPPETETIEPKISADIIKLFFGRLGVRKSIASITAAADSNSNQIDVRHVPQLCSKFGIKCSLSATQVRFWQSNWSPILAQLTDDTWVIVTEIKQNEHVKVVYPGKTGKPVQLDIVTFKNQYAGFSFFAKKLSDAELSGAEGHWFFSAFKSSKWIYFQVLIAAMLSNFLALTTSIFTMTVYDRIIPNSAIDSLYALSVGVFAALGFDFIVKMLRARFIDVASKKADSIVSERLFDRITSMNQRDISQQNSGNLAGLVREFETLREFFTSSTLVVIVDIPFVFFFVYVITLVAGPLGYVPLATIPLVLLVGLIAQPFMAKSTKLGMDNTFNKQGVLVEVINGMETIQATGSSALLKQRYADAQLSQSNTSAKTKIISQFVVNFAASVQQFAQIAIIFFGVFLVGDGSITQGALIAAVILGGRAMAPLGQLANVLSRINSSMSAYKSLNKLFKNTSTSTTNTHSVTRDALQGDIEFKNVSFSYDEMSEPIVRNISFKIKNGQKVAIVGAMGSGKTSLIKLAMGSIKPTTGNILIDGVDIRQLDGADISSNIGVMFQESWLFSGTIRENITGGNFDIEDEQLLNASKTSTADDFISKFPAGYDTFLKEKGGGLSGGQKQTISLARAILKNPPILILDEPTSSMDQRSEAKVLENLKPYLSNKTAIIVTHRNSILQVCDRVIVMEHGSVVADTTPDQLGVPRAAK